MEIMDRLRGGGGNGQRLPRALAGSLFIAEILFGTLMLASLGPVVIAAVVALLTTRLLSPGATTLYEVHLSETLTAGDYGLIVIIGLLAGVCGPLLMWLMTVSHALFLRLKLSPPSWRSGADRRDVVASHAQSVG